MYRNSLVKRNLFDIQYPKYSRIDCQLLTISSKVKIVSTYLTYLLIEIVEHFGQRRKDRVAQQRERRQTDPQMGKNRERMGRIVAGSDTRLRLKWNVIYTYACKKKMVETVRLYARIRCCPWMGRNNVALWNREIPVFERYTACLDGNHFQRGGEKRRIRLVRPTFSISLRSTVKEKKRK